MLAKAYSCPPEPVPLFYAPPLTTIAPNNSLEPILEPLDRLRLIDTVTGTNFALASSSLGYPLTRSRPIITAESAPHPSQNPHISSAQKMTYMQQ